MNLEKLQNKKLLEEQRKSEALEAAMEEVRIREDDREVGGLIIRSEGVSDSSEKSDSRMKVSEESLPKSGSEWFGLDGDGK